MAPCSKVPYCLFSLVTCFLSLQEAQAALSAGELVGLPTETVYGLAANALDSKAVAKIFRLKKRPLHNPIISHLPDAQAVFRYGEAQAMDRKLARFWPGPLSLLLKHNGSIPAIVSAGLEDAAFRVPSHPLMRKLLRKCPFPVAAPSANISGGRSPTRAEMIQRDFGSAIAGVVDGGPCILGIESSVLRSRSGHVEILRPGAISCEVLQKHGFRVKKLYEFSKSEEKKGKKLLAPGNLTRHYAPAVPLLLLMNEKLPRGWEGSPKLKEALARFGTSIQQSAYLAFGKESPAAFGHCFSLSEDAKLAQAAQRLFYLFEKSRRAQAQAIVSHLLPACGIGHALNDRLTRAASIWLELR